MDVTIQSSKGPVRFHSVGEPIVERPLIHWPVHTHMEAPKANQYWFESACDGTFPIPEWTGGGWTFEPMHTRDAALITCPICKRLT